MKYCPQVTPLILAILCSLCSNSLADWKADLGYGSLTARLGGTAPNGTGIAVTQVEARVNANTPYIYRPYENDPEFVGKVFLKECTAAGWCDNTTDSSWHATMVGTIFYGITSSFAGGITTVGVNEANSWINWSMNVSSNTAPAVEIRRVQNHSWINPDTSSSNGFANDLNRRLDLMVNRDGVVVVVGVNNGAASPIPKNMSAAYNVLAVGLTNGGGSYGPVVSYGASGSGLMDGDGRVKPDIVAPAGVTSWATPMIGATAAVILQTQDSLNILTSVPAATRPAAKGLLARCLILAGATRDEFICWRKGLGTPSTDGTVPLDYRYGAGEANVDNSHRILTTNPQQVASGTATVTPTGWNYASIAANGTHQYFFDIPAGPYQREMVIAVNWNRHVSQAGSTLTPSLANIDLRLFNATGFTKGTQIDQSVSAIDNVELIVLRPAVAGRYLFEVKSNLAWDYAIAWDIREVVGRALPDMDLDGDVDAEDSARFRACATRSGIVQTAPSCAAADLDGDGDVDMNDFGRFNRCYTGSCVPAYPNCLR